MWHWEANPLIQTLMNLSIWILQGPSRMIQGCWQRKFSENPHFDMTFDCQNPLSKFLFLCHSYVRKISYCQSSMYGHKDPCQNIAIHLGWTLRVHFDKCIEWILSVMYLWVSATWCQIKYTLLWYLKCILVFSHGYMSFWHLVYGNIHTLVIPYMYITFMCLVWYLQSI